MAGERLLQTLDRRGAASDDLVRRAEGELRVQLPSDYVAFLKESNGAEGTISESSYVALWPVDELRAANDDYGVVEFAPGLLLFGSDGGDTAYAFDTTDSMTVVEVPFIGMSRDEVRPVAPTFSEFLERLFGTR